MPEPALTDVLIFVVTAPVVVSKVIQAVQTVVVAVDLAPTVTKVVKR